MRGRGRGRGGRGGPGRGGPGRGGPGRGGPGRGGPGRGGPGRGGPMGKSGAVPSSAPAVPIPYSSTEILNVWQRYVPEGTNELLDVKKMIRFQATLGKEIDEEDADTMIRAFLEGPELVLIEVEKVSSASGGLTTLVEEEEEEEKSPTISFEQFARLYSERAGVCSKQAMQASIEMIRDERKGENNFYYGKEIYQTHIKALDSQEKKEQLDTLETLLANMTEDDTALETFLNTMVEDLPKRAPLGGDVKATDSIVKNLQGAGSLLQMNFEQKGGSPAIRSRSRSGQRGSHPNFDIPRGGRGGPPAARGPRPRGPPPSGSAPRAPPSPYAAAAGSVREF